MPRDTYTHGHHESVLRSHSWRTAANSAAYLLPRLEAGQSLLDVGCGPGTITVDLARRVAPGEVIGIDAAEVIVETADALRAEEAAANVSFRRGDVYQLDFDDHRFDVVHAHQVLQHLVDPVAALVEMRRVLRPGGLLAARDSDYAAFAWAPADDLLDRWRELYRSVTRRNRAESDAGRYLLGWVQQAGFSAVEASSSTWTFADPESREWWGGLWADRITQSAVADQAIAYELSDREELEAIAQAWQRWADQPDGWIAILHGEVLATR